MRKKPSLSRIVTVGFLLALGLLGFLSTRTMVQASSPEYTLREVMEIHAEDAREPLFMGTMHGITFKNTVSLEDIGCSDKVVSATPEMVANSTFNFVPEYLPSGFEQANQYASECSNELVALARVYEGNTGRFEVVRGKGHALVSFDQEGRMKTIYIGSEPAILIITLPGPGTPKTERDEDRRSWRLIAADDLGTIEIRSAGLHLSEGLKIMRGLLGR